MTGITAAIPYAFSALAQLKWRRADQREMHTPRFARDAGVAIVALIFSILFVWYSRNTGQEHWYVVWGPFLMAGAALVSACRSTCPCGAGWQCRRRCRPTAEAGEQ